MKTKKTCSKLFTMICCLYFVHFALAHQLPDDLLRTSNSSYITIVVLELNIDDLMSNSNNENNSYIDLLEANTDEEFSPPCDSERDADDEEIVFVNRTCGQLDHINDVFFRSLGRLVDTCNNYAIKNNVSHSLHPRIISPQILLDTNHHDFGTLNAYGATSITFECGYLIEEHRSSIR